MIFFLKKLMKLMIYLIQGQDFESIITTYDLKKPDPIAKHLIFLD